MDSTPTAPITGSRVVMDPSTTTRILTPVSRLTSFVTPTEDVFVIAHMGIARVDAGAWRLAVDGLVDRALTLTYDDLCALPSRTVTSFIECYGNPVEPDVPTRRVGNVVWRGVALRDLLLRAGVSPRATHVCLEGADSGTFANGTRTWGGSQIPAKASAPEDRQIPGLRPAWTPPKRPGNLWPAVVSGNIGHGVSLMSRACSRFCMLLGMMAAWRTR